MPNGGDACGDTALRIEWHRGVVRGMTGDGGVSEADMGRPPGSGGEADGGVGRGALARMRLKQAGGALQRNEHWRGAVA